MWMLWYARDRQAEVLMLEPVVALATGPEPDRVRPVPVSRLRSGTHAGPVVVRDTYIGDREEFEIQVRAARCMGTCQGCDEGWTREVPRIGLITYTRRHPPHCKMFKAGAK